ncbi:MAG: DUF3368 domain-containing protein [Anaerolineae bacterium]|nr:DUF3368 domain-containing protein [Anaerolineae bacterium]
MLDNTVTVNFALVQHTDWLRDVWPGMLVTPEEAWMELQAGIRLGRLPDADWSWLTVLPLTESERNLRDQMTPPLDQGEAACLALAYSRGYALLTDDRVARREARRMGVPVSGTIGVLKSLVDEGYISLDAADAALQQMIAFGYYAPIRSLRELR